jgi:hypothetical protein
VSPEAQAIKAKIDKWDYIKLFSFHTTKENSRVKRQPTEWEKILLNHLSDKEFPKYVRNY